ncbi:MAG: ABC-F family ATP-binding cassette domain-containing protein [Chloroflexi bacterium]|nr:ABC-F family ATP-binding cassette domain-containing protein [Chloroflexota bacterium]
MLKVSAVSKSYGADPVLRGVSFVLSPGERAGLVGPNGSGKSTLLRLLAGELRPDAGSVWQDPADRVAYLPQYPLDELHLTVRESLLRGAGRVGELERCLGELEQLLPRAEGAELDRLLARYAEVREEFERLDGYALEARLEAVSEGLALDVAGQDMPVSALSGGNKTKLSLARLLLSGANILLLDEPTKYLDLPAVLWLERFIREGDRSYVIVSHDRRFLDRTVSTILEIDPVKHTLRQWPGTFSDYAAARRREEQKQLAAYQDQQERIERIEEDIRRTKEQARGVEARTKSGMGADVQRRLAKKVAKKAKAREHRLERTLETERVEKPRQRWNLHLVDLGGDPIEDQRLVLEVAGLRAGYEGEEVLAGAYLLLRGRDRVALLGENGSGKSTLLRCIAGTMPYEGTVRLGPSVRLGVMTQEGGELPPDRTVLDVFRSRTEMYEDEARTYLHKFLFAGQEVHKGVRSLSYGQRAKLALAILVLAGANFLVLDEPTSHLDMPALEAVEQALAAYRGPLLVVSHDRYFLERIGITRVEVMEAGRLRPLDTVEQYEEEVLG